MKDRLLFRPVIESLKCLETNVLRSVTDGNIGQSKRRVATSAVSLESFKINGRR